MAAAIPVSEVDVRTIVNLPNEPAINDVLKAHSALALAYLKAYTKTEYYDEASGETPGADLATAYKFAFSFKLFESVIEFLNLKTIGTGIIKSTGIDDQAAELLTVKEIESYKKQFELRALTQVLDYLNTAGQNRYRELLTGSRSVRGTRACVISGDVEDDVWTT